MDIENLKVLVVDDHMIIRNILRQYLNAAGVIDIIDAPNGADALGKIEHAEQVGTPFNVIFTDWSMPGMDGLSLLKEARQRQSLDHTAFVMITAESEKAKIMDALRAGVTSYMIKPFSQEDLIGHLQKVLDWLRERA